MIIHYQTVARPTWRTMPTVTPSPSPESIVAEVLPRLDPAEWAQVSETERVCWLVIRLEDSARRYGVTVTRQTLDTIEVHE